MKTSYICRKNPKRPSNRAIVYKKTFVTQEAAEIQAKSKPNPLVTYACEYCGMWHLARKK